MDYLNPCNKNQTAKILERFFYVSNGREYISVIPDEAERITKLPTLDEVKEDTNRVVTYAKEIILNADKYKDMDIEESVLKQYACDIDPLLDKIIAINIADILSQNNKPQNKEQLKNVWVGSLEELKKDFIQGFEEDNSLLLPQNAVGGNGANALKEVENAENTESSIPSFSTLFDGSDFGDRISYLSQQFQNGKISAHDYFQSIRDELANTDFSEFTDQAAAAQQFFTDSTQQVASGMSDLINSYNKGEISATEYLDGYTSMAETLSALTDDLQNNSAAWNENGEAISDGTNQALDNAQSDLASAIEGINQYQDSIYSLEQITSGAITAGSDEFTAHAQVIAEDLAYIVQNGGYMADQIASTMGTTTSEIANSLTNSVDNQALASQAIAGNTNASIEQMANAVSTLFAELGNQIGNFKATINFAPKVNGVEHFSAIKIGGKEIVGGDIPNLTYDIKGLELGKIEALPKDKAFDLVQDVGTNGLKADEVPIIAQKGEAVLTKEQIENLAKTLHLVPVQNEIMEKMSKISLGDLPMNTPKMNFDASKVGQNVTRNNFAPSVNITFNCPNLTNESGVQYVEKAMDKYMNKFANDFYQTSLHYVNRKQ